MKKNMKKIGVASILLVLVLLLGLAGWLIFGRREANVGVQEAANELGIEWYDENETEFVLTTAEELYELQKLSGYYDFAGQTIKLGADIVFNEGNAEDWKNKVTFPDKAWESIYGFAGTFDGQGHTISGIYCIGYLYTGSLFRTEQTDYVTAGLFRNTSKDCVIKNFKLVNSFFDGDLNWGSSCISSWGGGTFENIYVDAILTSQKNFVGGIMGRATEDVTVRNCWFDGEINVIGGYGRPTGGIVAQAPEGKKCVIEHCLMSGEMNNDLYQRGVNMGGIIGSSKGGTVEITDCLVSGTLNNEWQIVGSAIGNVPAESVATLSHVYTIEEAWPKTIGHTTGELNGTPVTYPREKLFGYGGYQWTSLDFDNYWAVVDGGTPVLKTFAENPLSLDGVARMVDLTWYDDEKDTFEIHDLADFYGFALLSYSYDFEGKTVKLCADITINNGKASDWAKNAPEYDWISIGSANLPFKGTFDGQMHTISGVYLKTDKTYNGLFGMTSDEAVIKRFRLTNSYFESSAASFGSIAGRGVGTFDTIYSNAIVRSSNGNIGGFIGQVTGGDKLTIKNCWFDGSVKSTANDLLCRKIGGLLGFVITKVEISNCLNSGTVDASIYDLPNSATSKSIQPYVGGFIGQIHPNGEARISDSMNVGKVLYNEKATSSFGSIIGTASGDKTRSRAFFDNVYATKESCKRTATGYITGQVLAFDEETLKGIGGYQWTMLNYNKYWSVVENSTSILKSFAKKSPSVAGVERMIDISWYNEKETTYVLNDVADLYGFVVLSYTNDFAGKTVKLGADITVNTGNAADWATNAPAKKWMSISTATLPFAGTFDGQMHTISGLYLKADTERQGMFSSTAQTAVIKNFSLKNSYFESSEITLASISGRGVGTFDTIYTDAIIVSNKANVAGILAQATGGTVKINNCWFDGTIKCTGTDATIRRAGGMVGFVVADTEITNSLSTGTIDATETTHWRPYMGGFCGQIYKTASVNISESMAAGTILPNKEATSSYGSVIGYAEKKATLTEVYAVEDSCEKTASGSLSGQIIVYDRDRITGYGGYQWTTLDFDKYWSVVMDDTSVLKSFATSIPSLAGVEPMLDISWYNEEDKTFTLDTEAEFFGFALLASMNNFKGKTIILGDNMNIANEGFATEWATKAPAYEWLSIGTTEYPFAGTFDGKGYEISGIYQSTEKENSGLFGVTADTAVIKDFSLTNSYFESTAANLGSIAGRGIGTFSKIYSDAIVVSNSGSVGGFIGRTTAGDDLEMSDCWFAGSVTNNGNSTTNRYTGGFIGRVFNDVNLTNCLNTGSVSAEKYTVTESATDSTIRPYIGGLVGFMGNKKTLTITSCINAGELKISNVANTGYGSVVGRVDSKTTANASNTYTVTDYCDVITSKHPSSTTNLLTVVQTSTLAEIIGAKALAKMPGLFLTEKEDGTYQNDWAAVADGAPVPVCFAEGSSIEADTSWYDKSGTYELSDRADVYGFALLSTKTNFAGETIKLKNRITINEGEADSWSKDNAPAYPWICISQDTAFQGTFDGQGHTISGVYINESVAQRGMFAKVGASATIKNFNLKEAYMYFASDHSGGIAGNAAGTFENIYSEACVVGNGYNLGGMIGRANGGDFTMNNCWMNGNVTDLSTSKGGVGGLIGRIHIGNDAVATITNCLNSNDVTSKAATGVAANVGGLIGWRQSGTMTVSNCLNTGNVICQADAKNYGSIMGTTSGTISSTYADSSSKGTVALTNMPELFKYQNEEDKYESYWAITLNGTPILADFATVANMDCMPIDLSWYDGDGDYTLSDASDLYGMVALSKTTNFAGEVIKLGADIDVNAGNFNAKDVNGTKANSYTWPGIGTTSATSRFQGTFDGQMHMISGIYLNGSANDVGLFLAVGNTDSNTLIQNLAIENSYIKGKMRVGSLIGDSLGGTIKSVYSDAVVEGSDYNVGGLVGRAKNDTLVMQNCWFAGSVNNTNSSRTDIYVGGLLGNASIAVTLDNCLNTGAVTSKKPATGGLIGYLNTGITANVTNSLNVGTVTSTASTGIGSILGGNLGTLTATGVYATNESCAYTVAAGTYTGVTACDVANLVGTNALTNAPALYVPQLVDGKYVAYWGVSEYTPVLSSFAKYAKAADNQTAVSFIGIDVSWYDSEKATYSLADVADFYGLALLSKVEAIDGFAEKTIQLSDDMDINPTWTASETAPTYTWPGIGEDGKAFQGVFDGNGRTIRGIYTNLASKYAGLFRITGDSAEIKNFALLNTYIKGGHEFIGSIAGQSGADIDSVYSDAIVVSGRQGTGGFVGRTSSTSDLTITNCWFAGSVTQTAAGTGPSRQYTGGFIGRAQGKVKMKDCLNSGTVSAPNYTYNNSGVLPYIAGFVGYSNSSVEFTNCLNVGTVSFNTAATGGYGAILGAGVGNVKFNHVYAMEGSCRALHSVASGVVDEANDFTFKTAAKLEGEVAKEAVKALFDSGRWTTGQWPILKLFESLVQTQ